MKISFWEKITGLNKDELNLGEIDLIDGSQEQEEDFFNQLEKKSSPLNEKEKELMERPWMEDEGQLTVDVYQTPNEVVIQSTIAGIKKKDLNIDIEKDFITIKGERKTENAEKAEYLHQECFWGKFSRSIVLPQEIDPKQIKTSLKNGVLTVFLPKIKTSSEKKPRK
ncbi:MAG: HSP20 family protein [Parcubacteria group bacterium Athens1014_10]|nr:MAG: HSP20 family protein [Parcubacteria group bacterium Athens1014_10]TSD05891.1 MAG: HSP20 family protein [Parcubacteria group bacterium Athens0714_12]